VNTPHSLEAAGFPPAGVVFPLAGHRLVVHEGEHPWVTENQADIEENWTREVAANPALFNGRMVFQRSLLLKDGHIQGDAYLAPFATFLHWRRLARPAGGFHLFALPLPISSDGALIAIRMGRHTANPGRVYCAAGSMDESDVVSGHCDLDFNMRREVLEETGFDIAAVRADAQTYALQSENTVTVFRRFFFDLTAEQMLDRIAAHVAADPEPEIDCALAIRDANPTAHDYPAFMPLLLNWLFDRKG
jgi:8-oxo-dGTP pyrophosphatase MutT (NUDIX family)